MHTFARPERRGGGKSGASAPGSEPRTDRLRSSMERTHRLPQPPDYGPSLSNISFYFLNCVNVLLNDQRVLQKSDP